MGPRQMLVFAAASLLASMSTAASSQAPKISKPRPAPGIRPNVLPLPPAVYDKELAIGGEDVKARKTSSRLSVDVFVNSRGPYKFVVDSGADTSVVGLRIARDLALPLGKPAVLHSTTATSIVDRVKVDSLTLGQSTVRNLQLPALSEMDVGGDGLIGIDALVAQRLLLDFDRRLIKVEDARVPTKILPDEIVVVARRSRGQLILTQIQTSGVSVDAVIDTGSEVTVGNLALREKLKRRRHGEIWTVPATDVTGTTMKIEMTFIEELQIGPITLNDVPIAFADLPPFGVFGLKDQPALLLGTDLLESFRRVSLDFRARKVRFQLKKCGSSAVAIRTASTGLSRLSATADQGSCGL